MSESLFSLMRKKAQEEGLKFRDKPSYGDMIPIEEFRNCVESGSFIDYDGHGEYAKEDKVSNIVVIPSEFENGTCPVPEWATHVCWYNR